MVHDFSRSALGVQAVYLLALQCLFVELLWCLCLMFIFVITKNLNLMEGMMIIINEMVTVMLYLVFSSDSSSLVWAGGSGDVVERFVLFRPGCQVYNPDSTTWTKPKNSMCEAPCRNEALSLEEVLFMYTLFNLFLKSAGVRGPNGEFRCFRREHTFTFSSRAILKSLPATFRIVFVGLCCIFCH